MVTSAYFLTQAGQRRDDTHTMHQSILLTHAATAWLTRNAKTATLRSQHTRQNDKATQILKMKPGVESTTVVNWSLRPVEQVNAADEGREALESILHTRRGDHKRRAHSPVSTACMAHVA